MNNFLYLVTFNIFVTVDLKDIQHIKNFSLNLNNFFAFEIKLKKQKVDCT